MKLNNIVTALAFGLETTENIDCANKILVATYTIGLENKLWFLFFSFNLLLN